MLPLDNLIDIFDSAGALQRTDNDVDFLGELVEILYSDLTTQLFDIEKATAAEKFDEVARSAHTMKGAFGNVGARAVADCAARLEQAAKRSDSNEVVSAFTSLRAATQAFHEVFSLVKTRLTASAS